MRQLCSLDGETQAQQFAAYLFTLGIAATIDVEMATSDPATSKWVIWILEEDDMGLARQELDQFLENPDDPRYAEAVRQAGQLLKEEAEKREQIQKQQVNIQNTWRQRAASTGRPLTITLLLVCVAVFLFSGSGSDMEGTTMRALQFVDLPAAYQRANERVAIAEKGQQLEMERKERKNIEHGQPTDRFFDLRKGQVWRVVTPIFIHLGLMHLVFNMIWLYQLGGVLESRYKSVSFGGLVLFTGVAGVLAQCCMPYEMPFAPLNGGVLGGGMSGVVFGLLGFAWVKTRLDPSSGLVLRGDIFGFMMIWLVLGFSGILDSLIGGSIANWAHGGGLLAGMLVGYLSIRRR